MVQSEEEILNDPSTQLVLSSAIPNRPRQTKEAARDRQNLKRPRHISTLHVWCSDPDPPVSRCQSIEIRIRARSGQTHRQGNSPGATPSSCTSRRLPIHNLHATDEGGGGPYIPDRRLHGNFTEYANDTLFLSDCRRVAREQGRGGSQVRPDLAQSSRELSRELSLR